MEKTFRGLELVETLVWKKKKIYEIVARVLI